MRIALLTANAGDPRSGQSRFLNNLALGLKRARVDVTVFSVTLQPEAKQALSENSISSYGVFDRPSGPLLEASKVTRIDYLSRKLATLVRSAESFDWCVNLSDELVSIPRFLKGRRIAWVSNGDFALLFFNRRFYADHRLLKAVLSLDASRMLLAHAQVARSYDILLANSQFTKSLMSFVYGTPFMGVVYPPVDRDFFIPPSDSPSSDYVLALARNEHDYGLPVIEALAGHLPVKVVGGARVAGAENLGHVSNLTLRTLYQSAAFLAFPTTSEPFGYAPVEAMACGTPSLVFDCGGPGETIVDGENGWKVTTEDAFVGTAKELFSKGISGSTRTKSRDISAAYSIESSTMRLLSILDCPGPQRQLK